MKQIKKIQNNQTKNAKIKQTKLKETNEVTRLFQIILIVFLVFLVFFAITYFLTKPKKTTPTETPTTIQYKEILVGEIWNQGGSYYVLAGKEDDQYLSLYRTYLDLYIQEKDENATYYILNQDSIFNQKYVAEESNLYTEVPGEFRMKDATLLYVTEGKVVAAYEGKDAILSQLQAMLEPTE